MKALYFNNFGKTDVIQYGELSDPVLAPGELLIRTEYIGLNYADIYRRGGTYHIEQHTPFINGYEGVGMIEALGADVTDRKIGERVLFVDVPLANAELVAVPATHAIPIPPTPDLQVVASIGLQGLTADFLAHDLGTSPAGSKVFIHGISGGVGQILSQMLAADGHRVFGVTSSEEKRHIALSQGAEAVYLRDTDWLADNVGTFDVVFDGIGSTVPQSLELLKHRGKLVFFGMAGGNPTPVDLVALMAQSKSIMTGDLWDFLQTYDDRVMRSNRLFKYFTAGQITVTPPTIFPLADGRAATEFLETGRSIGKILLQP